MGPRGATGRPKLRPPPRTGVRSQTGAHTAPRAAVRPDAGPRAPWPPGPAARLILSPRLMGREAAPPPPHSPEPNPGADQDRPLGR